MSQTTQDHSNRVPPLASPASLAPAINQELPGEPQQPAAVGITIRAAVIGLALGMAASWGGYINDYVMGMTGLNVGHLPVILVGVVIIAMMTINPLLGLLERALGNVIRLRILPAEWAIILAISCVAVPVMNQLGMTLPCLIAPAKQQVADATSKKNETLLENKVPAPGEKPKLKYLPENILVNDGVNDEHVVGTYLTGAPQGTQVDSKYMEPVWKAWTPVLLTWLPIMGCFFLAMLALTLVVHRQWATREHIRFPIADFISTIIHGRPQTTLESAVAKKGTPLFRIPLFWVFFGAIFGIHLLNGLSTMYYSSLPMFPLKVEMFPVLLQKFPKLATTGLAFKAYQGLIFPSIVAFSFFLSREISLAVGVVPLIHEIYVLIMIASFGINPKEGSDVCWNEGFSNMGAFLAFFIGILFLGRSYYFPLVAEALGIRPLYGGRTRSRLAGVWTMRLFLLATAATIVLLITRVHIEWPFAIIFVAVLMIIQVVVARINVETGIFVYGLLYFGNEVVISIFGFEAMGPRLAMLSALFMIIVISAHGSQPLAPIAINLLEVCRRQKVKVNRVAALAAVTIVAGLCVTTYVGIESAYHKPEGQSGFKSKWAVENATWPFLHGNWAINKLSTNQTLEKSVNMSAWERVTSPKPIRNFATWLIPGFLITMVLFFLRLRYSWWPIHPVAMAVWGVAAVAGFSFSFLIGWMLRSAIAALFGEAAIEKIKPMMIGVIAGELVAAVFWLAVGWIYYSHTGTQPLNPYVVLNPW